MMEAAPLLSQGPPRTLNASDYGNDGELPGANATLPTGDRVHDALLGVFLGLLSLLTVAMNLLVLFAVRREKSLHTVGNLYIVSLSLADLIVGATVMPLNLVYLLDDEWRLGRAVCQFWLIMDYVASTASIFSLFILCLDRYRSIRQPLRYLKYRTRGKASAMITGAWLLSLTWIIPILGWRSFTHVDLKPEDENKCDTDFRFVTWFKVVTAVCNFYVPSMLMVWFYTHIYIAVRQHLRDRERIIHPTDSFGENAHGRLAPTSCGECEPPAAASGKRPPSDQSTVEQTCSLEDVEPTKAAPCRSHRKIGTRCPQMSPLAPTAKPKSRRLSQRRSNAARRNICLEERRKKHGEASVGGVCGSGQVSDVQRCNGEPPWSRGGAGGDPAGEVSLRQTWQRFIEQSSQRIKSLRIHKEHKAAKQLGFIIAAFLLCWIPYFIAFMVMAFCRECVRHDLHMFTIWLGYMNSTLNPFIYPLCNRNFKRVFKNILHVHL